MKNTKLNVVKLFLRLVWSMPIRAFVILLFCKWASKKENDIQHFVFYPWTPDWAYKIMTFPKAPMNTDKLKNVQLRYEQRLSEHL